MSQFLPEPQAGQSAPSFAGGVSDQDIANAQTVLAAAAAQPTRMPESFWTYVVDFLAVNQPPVPVSLVTGFAQFTAQTSEVAASESTSSVTPVDLTTVGPQLTTVPMGQYIVLFGATGFVSVAGNDAIMSLFLNGVAVANATARNGATTQTSFARAVRITLSPSSNTLATKYSVVATTGTFGSRWLIALKYANV